MLNCENTETKMANRKADAFLLIVAVLLLFWGLGDRGLWASEGRWAEITREMFLNKDFFRPTIGGEPYYDKPLLTYWFIAAITAVTNRLDELVVRVPSAVAGIVVVLATINLGRRLWSEQTGRIAGWLVLTTYGLIFWSRTAAADTENLAAIILCVAWYWAKRDKPDFKAFLVFYLVAFLGALTKGLAAIAVPICAVLPDVVVNKRWRILFKPSHIAALVIGALVYFVPFVYSSVSKPGDYAASGIGLVFRENIQRFFAPFDHTGPVYTYVIYLPVLFMPWAPLLIISIMALIRKWKELDYYTRWLVYAAAMVFMFFTASGSRRSYYILPALPFCALITAVFLVYLRDIKLEGLRRLGLGIQEVMLGALIGLELSSPVIFKILKARTGFDVSGSIYISTTIISIFAIIVWILIRRSSVWEALKVKTDRRLSSVIAVTAILLGGYFCWQLNVGQQSRTERNFAVQLTSRTTHIPSERVGLFPKNDAKLLFYLNKSDYFSILTDKSKLKGFLMEEKPRVLVCKQRYIPSEITEELKKYPQLTEEIESWESKSRRKERWTAWFLDKPLDKNLEIKTETITHEK